MLKDAGQGIDSEILPRLFTKFATKSIVGTGRVIIDIKEDN